jgi:hypothetical protein
MDQRMRFIVEYDLGELPVRVPCRFVLRSGKKVHPKPSDFAEMFFGNFLD